MGFATLRELGIVKDADVYMFIPNPRGRKRGGIVKEADMVTAIFDMLPEMKANGSQER